jgi:hypothetical protein
MTCAAGIGISPDTLIFDSCFRDRTYGQEITIINPDTSTAYFEITQETETGINIKATPQKGEIKPKQRIKIQIEATIPIHQANGKYYEIILINLKNDNNKNQIAITPSLAIPITLPVYGEQHVDAKIESMNAHIKEDGSVEIISEIQNTGDVKISPEIKTEITPLDPKETPPDDEGYTVEEQIYNIMPNTKTEHIITLESEELKEGEYQIQTIVIYEEKILAESRKDFNYTRPKEEKLNRQANEETDEQTPEENNQQADKINRKELENESADKRHTEEDEAYDKEARTGEKEANIIGKATSFLKAQDLSLVDLTAFIVFAGMLTATTIIAFRKEKNNTKKKTKKKKN